MKEDDFHMVDYTNEAVVRNLKDAGCDQETIDRFLHWMKEGATKEQLQLLARHRGVLLDKVHAEEKRIRCLDYLIYQIEHHKIAI